MRFLDAVLNWLRMMWARYRGRAVFVARNGELRWARDVKPGELVEIPAEQYVKLMPVRNVLIFSQDRIRGHAVVDQNPSDERWVSSTVPIEDDEEKVIH